MKDSELHEHIESLIAEEHRLLGHGDAHSLSADDRARLDRISVTLDQYWDLLRQRRARRDAGQDPDVAHMRDENVVERYQQ
jgi:hypothetical protein